MWEERRCRNPTGFSPCEVYETTVLLVFSSRVPHYTWFTYNPLTDSETNMSCCCRITKEGSIPRCQSLRFIRDWLGGIKSCLPRVKPVNKTTLLKKKTPPPPLTHTKKPTKQKKPTHKTTARCQRLLWDRSANNSLENNWAIPVGDETKALVGQAKKISQSY